MEKEGKRGRGGGGGGSETDFLITWGNRKRLRCVKVKEDDLMTDKSDGGVVLRKKITSRVDRRVVSTDNKEAPSPPQPHRLNNSRDLGTNRLNGTTSSSPEKEDRYYTTRGSLGGLVDENGKVVMDAAAVGEERGGSVVWPKLFISLSSKEKEEDFMAMKGCKLPQRPKKRAKFIQRTLLLVSPGAWLSDLCQERYEVREKKASKKRPRGLKAMGSMESDSE